MLAWFKRIEDWITDKLWAEDLRTTAPLRSLMISAARIAVYAFRSFRENVVGIQAAGLTMFTVLGLFPLLWLAFFVAKMFGFSDRLMQELDEFLGQTVPPNLQSAVDTLKDLVEHANRQDLELWGVLVLVYTGYALFNKVEEAFNHVWQATSRSWYKRVGSFIGLVVIVPVLMLAAFVTASFLPRLYLVELGLRWAPLVVLWVALTLLYKAMPSATVRWTPAALGAALAALVVGGLHLLYLSVQFGVAQYNALYAALAVIPMLLVYVELIWTVLLAGMQVTYAIQNIHSLGAPKAVPPATHLLRRRLALAMVAETQSADDSLSLGAFARTHEVPREWVDRVAKELHEAALLRIDDDGFAWTSDVAPTAWEVVRVVEGGEPDERLALSEAMEEALANARRASEAALSDVDVTGRRADSSSAS